MRPWKQSREIGKRTVCRGRCQTREKSSPFEKNPGPLTSPKARTKEGISRRLSVESPENNGAWRAAVDALLRKDDKKDVRRPRRKAVTVLTARGEPRGKLATPAWKGKGLKDTSVVGARTTPAPKKGFRPDCKEQKAGPEDKSAKELRQKTRSHSQRRKKHLERNTRRQEVIHGKTPPRKRNKT